MPLHPPLATLLIRFAVGWVFLTAGSLKFIDPGQYGTGRFVNLGFPVPELLGPLVGGFEVLCGALVLAGLFTRLAAVPLIVIMTVAIAATKVPTLAEEGFWTFMNDARLDVAMLSSALFLLFAGAGAWSLDAVLRYRPSTRTLVPKAPAVP
jgi:putative oxidoreductase